MVEVKFYDNVDDKLLKFAVIIAKTNGKWFFASIGKEIHTKCLADTEKTEKIFWLLLSGN